MRDMRDIDLQNLGTQATDEKIKTRRSCPPPLFCKKYPASIYRGDKVDVSHVSHVSHPQIAQKCKILKIPTCLSPILKCLSLCLSHVSHPRDKTRRFSNFTPGRHQESMLTMSRTG